MPALDFTLRDRMVGCTKGMAHAQAVMPVRQVLRDCATPIEWSRLNVSVATAVWLALARHVGPDADYYHRPRRSRVLLGNAH